MRVLLTGGAGFLGSELCLAHGDDDVVVVDDFSTGRRDNIPAGFRVVRADVTGARWLQNPEILDGFDQIYHLACPASPPQYQRNPVQTLTTAFMGTLHVLELARMWGARVLVASTSEVYGSAKESPQREDFWAHLNPVGPRSCYDSGKLAAEALCVAYRRQYGVDARIARIHNTYGPGMRHDDGRVVSNFIMQVIRGDALTIYGDGTQTRSFCYVDDTIDALVKLMDHPTWDGSPVNVGNPEEITMIQLADAVYRAAGEADKTVETKPLPEDDPPRRCPDIGKLQSLIPGWKPSMPLATGIKATMEWFKEEYEL